MKRTVWLMIVGQIALLALNRIVQAQALTDQAENPDLAAQVKQLAAEIKALKLEIAALQLEPQQSKVAKLERELKQARIEKRRMEYSLREFYQKFAALDAQLSQATLTPEEQAELGAERATLLTLSPEKIIAQQQQIAQREAELAERLQQEQARLQALTEVVKKLSADLSGLPKL